MRIPILRGSIDRRILANYHADPQIVAPLLPPPFRPQIVYGKALVGICLIRLRHVRPRFFPAWMGISSENAAHRFAVEWDEGGSIRQGVFIRRRDTSSLLNALAGGRLFPGIHHRARFQVEEGEDRYAVAMHSADGVTHLSVRGHRTRELPKGSVFGSLEEASAFFAAGSLGYSVTAVAGSFHGMELRCRSWQVEPLEIERVQSSFFEDSAIFPKGSLEFDCALLMRGIEHEWHGTTDLCCQTTGLDLSSAQSLTAKEESLVK